MTAVLTYTLGGMLSSLLVGVVAGVIGLTLVGSTAIVPVSVAIALFLVAATWEAGFIRARLPQPRRQTRSWWSKQFPLPVASAMWGVEIGLTFTTWLTYAGSAALLCSAALLGDVKIGVIMLGAFWLGRAVPVWIAPMLIADVRDVDKLVEAVRDSRRDFARIHLLGVVACAVALVVLLGTAIELEL